MDFKVAKMMIGSAWVSDAIFRLFCYFSDLPYRNTRYEIVAALFGAVCAYAIEMKAKYNNDWS